MENKVSRVARVSRARLLRRADAAAYVRDVHNVPCAEATLATLACTGKGPTIKYVGRWPMYSEAALDAWIEARSSDTLRRHHQRQTAATG
jgi:hypothetical protein